MKERFESDHTDHHALRYRRLRVERQEVLYGDAWPLLCRRGDALVLCGRGGSLALSDDGVTWSQLPDLATPAAPGGVVLALTAGRDGTLVAAVQRSGTLMILGADEPAEPWRGIATLDVDLADSSRACLTGLADGSLLLCLPGRILRSADGGAAWEPAAELPAGCGTLHPLQLGSGRLVAPVGGAAGDIALAESDDGGGTWNLPDGFAPLSATVAELPDGRLVLSYGMPHFPYGARAVVGAPSDGAPVSWGDEVYVLALSRYAIREKARPVLAGAGVSAATVVTADGAIVSAFHRGAALGSYAPTIYGPGMDEWGRRPAIGVVRWTPEGLAKPPLVYPNLWNDRVDAQATWTTAWCACGPTTATKAATTSRTSRWWPTGAWRPSTATSPAPAARARSSAAIPTAAWSTPAATAASIAPPTRAVRGASWPRSRCRDATRRCSGSG